MLLLERPELVHLAVDDLRHDVGGPFEPHAEPQLQQGDGGPSELAEAEAEVAGLEAEIAFLESGGDVELGPAVRALTVARACVPEDGDAGNFERWLDRTTVACVGAGPGGSRLRAVVEAAQQMRAHGATAFAAELQAVIDVHLGQIATPPAAPAELPPIEEISPDQEPPTDEDEDEDEDEVEEPPAAARPAKQPAARRPEEPGFGGWSKEIDSSMGLPVVAEVPSLPAEEPVAAADAPIEAGDALDPETADALEAVSLSDSQAVEMLDEDSDELAPIDFEHSASTLQALELGDGDEVLIGADEAEAVEVGEPEEALEAEDALAIDEAEDALELDEADALELDEADALELDEPHEIDLGAEDLELEAEEAELDEAPEPLAAAPAELAAASAAPPSTPAGGLPSPPPRPPIEEPELHVGKSGTFHTAQLPGDFDKASFSTIDRGMRQVGYTLMGPIRLDHPMTREVVLVGYGSEGGDAWGTMMITPDGAVYTEFVTYFDDDSMLTTTTVPFVSDMPDIKVFRKSHPDVDVAELHQRHVEGLAERKERKVAALGLDGTLVGLCRDIDLFMTRFAKVSRA